MSVRRVSALAFLLVLVAALVLAPSACADSYVRIVRLSLVDGPVQIDRATGQGFEKAIMNMPITQGVKLSTPDDARAEVEFEDGTTLRLAPNTEVAFPELGLRSTGARFTTVVVAQGTAYFNVRHKGKDEFQVAFDNRQVRIDHDVHFRLDLTGGNPELAVFSGELHVAGPQERATVKKNETLTLDLGDAGRYDLARNVAPEPYDSWDTDRLQYASQYATSSYTANSPYYYGASDLNYYGAWSYWPGYGMLWRPFGVGYGWDPFYNGAWCWYPGFGYTWVSTYPWGWTPYRYGSWFFVPGYGWAWQPGAWGTWYTVPPVYNAPPTFHRPKPPSPVMVLGGTAATPHPTVVVDNGVGVIRNPRVNGPREDVVGARNPNRTAGFTSPSPTATAGTAASAPVRSMTPAAGTGIAAPGTAPGMRAPHSDIRVGHRDVPMRAAPPAGMPAAPPARMSAPPAPRMSAPPAPRMSSPPPAPRMSSPPPARMSSPPSGGGASRAGSGHSPK